MNVADAKRALVPAAPPARGTWRRPLEVMGALWLALLVAPVLLCVALLVRLGVGKPIFFIQARAGLGGRPFRLVKFRTMRDDRDAEGKLLPDAQRVTALGRLVRRTRLDELPELWNILKGEMAFVGPRPLLPDTVEGFGEAGRVRGSVRPGLTGWAQVNGNTRLTDDDKLALDLWYVAHRSLSLDARIVVRTLGVVMLGEKVAASELEQARSHARDHHRGG
jgi:lipopolysaccharide/colanic/teichoic acid biosynthesis glycosyltransferase